jgi:hypothetical protein
LNIKRSYPERFKRLKKASGKIRFQLRIAVHNFCSRIFYITTIEILDSTENWTQYRLYLYEKGYAEGEITIKIVESGRNINEKYFDK